MEASSTPMNSLKRSGSLIREDPQYTDQHRMTMRSRLSTHEVLRSTSIVMDQSHGHHIRRTDSNPLANYDDRSSSAKHTDIANSKGTFKQRYLENVRQNKDQSHNYIKKQRDARSREIQIARKATLRIRESDSHNDWSLREVDGRTSSALITSRGDNNERIPMPHGPVASDLNKSQSLANSKYRASQSLAQSSPSSPPNRWNWEGVRRSMFMPADMGGFFCDMHRLSRESIETKLWKYDAIKTLGAGKSSGRTHRLFKARITKGSHAFIKVVPYTKWIEQLDQMDEFKGEWVTDGENFVMEAAILACLAKRQCDIVPELYAISPVWARSKKELEESDLFRKTIKRNGKLPTPTHIAIVTELFGQDLHSKLGKYRQKWNDRRKEDSIAKANKIVLRQKDLIQQACALMRRFHDEGFCHLDFTTENILLGPDPMDPAIVKWKLCDFGKSTLRTTKFLRHVPNPQGREQYYSFESCEPTIGKSYFIPPECSRLLSRLDKEGIYVPCQTYKQQLFPLRHEKEIESNREKRGQYYFKTESADVYQFTVLLLIILSFGQASSKKLLPDPKTLQPIADDAVLKKLREAVPGNPIWDGQGLVDLIKRNADPDPTRRDTMRPVEKDLMICLRGQKSMDKENKFRRSKSSKGERNHTTRGQDEFEVA